MRHLWQWFCGYICVFLSGRQVNRFMNLCSKNGIRLWQISHELGRGLRVNIRLRDFYHLKPYLRKTKTRIRIISKRGFPFWCYRHPRLKWFLCICLFVFCLGLYSLNFIWNIEIKGNQKVSTEAIISCLQENSIEVGLKKRNIDCPNIELLLREQFQQIGWVSVYFEHTNLCVEVKESLYDVVDMAESSDGKMYNLVANKDAIIHSIVTRKGQAIVKKGQRVKKDEVLVLGKSEIYEDSGELKETLYFKADALVYADVVYEISIPCSEIEILALKIANLYDDTMLLRIGNNKLTPIIEKLEENGCEILENNLSLEKDEKSICFYIKMLVREQIGINIPAEEVEKNEFE